jgi:TonB family protein
MNTYEKHRGVGVLLLTKYPTRIFILSESAAADESKDLSSFPMRESVLRSIATKDLSSSPRKGSVLPPFSLCVSARRGIIGAHMEFQRIQNAIELFGPPPPEAPPAEPPEAPRDLPGQLEPKLAIAWGDFHGGLASSLGVLFRRPFAAKDNLKGTFFSGSWVEGRVPMRAVVAAALWHLAFMVAPFPQFSGPHKNPAFENTELVWSGPIEDFPLLEIPRQKAKPAARAAHEKPLPAQGADAFHPRQRIFTDPVHPTHPRQTLINPSAPHEPPKILPNLPNMVQLQSVAGPARPRLQISEETLKKLRPKKRRAAAAPSALLPDIPNAEQRPAEISLAVQQNAPARPNVELNTGSAPRLAQRAQTGDAAPAPDVSAAQLSAVNGSPATLIALSATPAPPATPLVVPQGNLAARVSISPEGKSAGAPGEASASGAGNNSIGVSISGGNPRGSSGVSGLGRAPKMNSPAPRLLVTRPEANAGNDDPPERSAPPNFTALPPGAKPEQIFASKRVYTLRVNMPNLNSATGSWILNFSELRSSLDAPRAVSGDLSGPVPLKKIDPKYPPTLISEHVEGEVILYAILRGDGSVDSIQLVRGVDEQLDANAMNALSQWKFRPATRQGSPVDLEAIVHIPFHAPEER